MKKLAEQLWSLNNNYGYKVHAIQRDWVGQENT